MVLQITGKTLNSINSSFPQDTQTVSGTEIIRVVSTSVFPCQFHSTSVPLLGKMKKLITFILMTGLHNKPQGCSVSVASAAGPLTAKK
jgi:hypothetical protein